MYTVVDIMTLIVRKTGKKFEQIHETNFHLEDKLQDLIHEDQIIKKIKLGPDDDVRLVGIEAAGLGVDTKKHAATMTKGAFGILHGSASYLLQTEDGQIQLPHSVSAGLDYPGVGPEHSFLKSTKRVEYISATDDEAVDAFKWLSEKEGILPALE